MEGVLEGNSTVRKRVTTLYSAEGEGEPDKEAPLRAPPPQNEDANTAGVVRQVAEAMFVSMCKGFDQEVITEENLEEAVQNLAADSINPTYSLVQTHAYAQSSEAIKRSIRKLLCDVLKRSSCGEVGKIFSSHFAAAQGTFCSCSALLSTLLGYTAAQHNSVRS